MCARVCVGVGVGGVGGGGGERERGTSNSGEQKQNCNCETNFSLKIPKLVGYKRVKERIYLYLKISGGRRKWNLFTKKEGMRKMTGLGRWWNIIYVDNWSKCNC